MEEKLDKDLKKQVEEQIEGVLGDGINMSNLDALGKLVDIHKDMSNIKYWKVKEDAIMRGRSRYGNHYDEEEYGRGSYGRGRSRDSRGRYTRRGGRERYNGAHPIDEMMECYEYYNDAAEEMDRGNYGAANEMVKSVEGIMKNICEIVEELAEADTPEVMEVIRKYSRKISEII